MNLKDMVKDKMVHFSFYRDGDLWYKTDDNFDFPVPISDIGNAIFMRDDKAILFMRYIRKQLDLLEKAKENWESQNYFSHS